MKRTIPDQIANLKSLVQTILIWAALMVLIWCLPVGAASPMTVALTGTGGSAGGTCSGPSPTGCAYRETFDGSNYCVGSSGAQNCNLTWTVDTNPPISWAYTTHKLQGTYAAEIASSDSIHYDLTAASSYYMTMWIYGTTWWASNSPLTIKDASGNILCSTYFDGPTRHLNISSSGGTESSKITLGADGTPYYFKYYAHSGASNATCTLWVSTDGSTWGTPVSSSNGTWTANIARISLSGSTDGVIDDVRINATDITSY